MQTIDKRNSSSQVSEIVLPSGEELSEPVVMSPIVEAVIPTLAQPDRAALRERALDLAGQFHSDIADLSNEHDRYLVEAFES